MKQLVSKAIVLSRTDYGEADRIVTFLTPDAGKLRLMARGVRKVKSKLAGGIELFSISDVTYLQGKGDLGTLISARLDRHYGKIVSDIHRVQLGYDLIKQLHRATEDHPGPEYFTLLQTSLASLDTVEINSQLIQSWFQAQLLKLAGHAPNLRTDTLGEPLDIASTYNFDFETMCFAPHAAGRLRATHIKVLRLLFADHDPSALAQVQDIDAVLADVQPLLRTLATSH